MNKKAKYTYVFLFIIILGFIYKFIDNYFFLSKNTNDISHSIEESKKREVFITEFKIEEASPLNDFPIKTVWMENRWHWEKDKYFFKKSVIDSLSSRRIIFNLNDSDSILTVENYLKDWIIGDMEGETAGLYSDMIIIENKTSIRKFTVYKTNKKYEFRDENLIPIFEFELLSK